MKKMIVALAIALSFSTTVSAQTATTLPQISLIGNATGYKGDFGLREIEIGFQSYLSPHLKGDVFLAFEKEDGTAIAVVEEAYITYFGDINNLSIIGGKKKLNFGKINARHPESWTMATFPDVLSAYLGEEGVSGEGIALYYTLPTPFFSEFSIGSFANKTSVGAPETFNKEILNARLWTSASLSPTDELEWGVSYLKGYGDAYEAGQDDVTIWGTDVTFTSELNNMSYWTSQTELLFLNRTLPDLTLNRFGVTSYLGFRADKNWDYGLRADYVQLPEEADVLSRSVTAQLGYHLSPTTVARIYSTYDDLAQETSFGFQFLFGFGPHSHVLN